MSEHEKCNIETLNQTTRHQNADIVKLEDEDESIQAALTTVLGALQCIYIVDDQSKCMLDDYGQKWKHTPAQFELNCKFACRHNPTDDSMLTGPGIFDNYSRQVNSYGETSVYKCDCAQLVPKPAPTPKTDCCDGSADRSVKRLSSK